MQKIECAKHIVHYGHHVPFSKGIRLEAVEDTIQVHIYAIHYEEDIAEGLFESRRRLLRWNQNIEQSGREYVILHLSQLTHNHNFTEHFPALVAVEEYVSD